MVKRKRQTFSPPPSADTYVADVHQRVESLIVTQAWNGITIHDLEAWLTNFSSKAESYLAACLLDSLIYRSKEQKKSLLNDLFYRQLPSALLKSKNERYLRAAERLLDQDLSRLLIIPVIKPDDPPTKSGPFLARELRQHMSLEHEQFLWPWDLKRSYPPDILVVFFDDFIGTGRQFRKFYTKFGFEGRLNKQTAIFAALSAHEKGKSYLETVTKVISSELIREDDAVFSRNSPVFSDKTNKPSVAREYYVDFAKRKGLSKPLGYGGLSLSYAFDHGTPNATLPVFWQQKYGFKPLIPR